MSTRTARDVDLKRRSTRDVIEDHLYLRQQGRLEDDLVRNYHPDVVMFSWEGINRGHDGVRNLADVLRSYDDPDGEYHYHQVLDDGEVATLRWSSGRGDSIQLHDGADTFIVRDGKIVVQTIHFSS